MSVAPEISPENTGIDEEHPWPGLESFTENDSEYFKGRDDETADLFRLVKRDTLTVLFGSSGLGKTSLLKAGLFPELIEAEFLPIYLRLTHSDAPEPLADQVRGGLEALIDTHHVDASKPRESEALSAYFHRKDVDFWGTKNRLLIPVLVFDQFEEMFTLARENEARQARANDFLKELADLVERRPPTALKQKWENGEEEVTNFSFERERCKIILSLREDYLSDLEGLRPYMRSVMRNRLRIRPMNGENAFNAVVKPAPGLVDDEVATRLVQLVADSHTPVEDVPLSEDQLNGLQVEPALLSLVCCELNTRRIILKQPKITADLLRGSYHDILKTFYNESVANLPPDVRFFIEDRLLTRSGYRTSVAIEDALAQKGMTQESIDRLLKRRLLRIEDRLNVHTIELTHDILTTPIRESRDARQKQAADAALAAERERAEREKQEAEAALSAERERAEREKQEAAEALAAKQAQIERERTKTRMAVAALIVSGICAGIALWFYVGQQVAKLDAERANVTKEKLRSAADYALKFTVFDLRDKLKPIGQLDVMQGVNEMTLAYFEDLEGSEVSDDFLYSKAVALQTRGDILFQKGEVGDALNAHEESLKILRSLTQRTPTNLDYRCAVSDQCIRVADVEWAQADMAGAMKFYNEAVVILQQLIKEKEAQSLWLKKLPAYRDRLADGLKAQGKLDEALKLYEQSLQERKTLAAGRADDKDQDKDANAEQEIEEGVKEELLLSYISIGDVLRALGDLRKALKYQRESLDFSKELVQAQRSDLNRQYTLSASYDHTGEALQDSGQLEEALEDFTQSNAIFQKLNEQDPTNADWKRNYSVTLVRLTNIMTVIGNTAVAGDVDKKVLELREDLAEVDESNANAKDDFSEACLRVGNSLLVRGNLKASAENYEKAFELRSETATKDSTNLDRQELLAESDEKLGDILFARGSLDDAHQDYEKSREIRQTLADKDPSNTLRQSAVATSNEKLGDAHRERGDIVSALRRFQQAVTIRKALAEKDPSNLQWQADLAIAYRKLAEIDVAQKNFNAAFEHLRQSLETLEKLTRLAPKNSEWRASLCDTRTAFADALGLNGKRTEALETFRPVLDSREELAKLDETNVKRQSELAHALYLAAVMAPRTAKSNVTAPATLKRAKDIMQSLKEKAELTAEQQRWLKEIEKAK